MFQHNTSPFGAFEKHTFFHEQLRHSFTLVPESGARLLSLVFQGREVLDGYRTPEELDFDRWGKSGPLLPFPNRLADGRYRWKGQTYQFPIDDPTTGNAIHGFGMDKTMPITRVDLTEERASVTCTFDYDGGIAAYPFPFVFTMEYRLDSSARFQLRMHLRNESSVDIPIGLGWHPYFKVAERADEMQLQLPPVMLVGVDERMLPTGKRYDYDEFSHLKPVGVATLDNCFAVDGWLAGHEVVLSGSRGTLRLRPTPGPSQFRFLQVFVPHHRQSLAIEPMTCNIDAFHNLEGLTVLPVGGMMEVGMEVEYEPFG